MVKTGGERACPLLLLSCDGIISPGACIRIFPYFVGCDLTLFSRRFYGYRKWNTSIGRAKAVAQKRRQREKRNAAAVFGFPIRRLRTAISSFFTQKKERIPKRRIREALSPTSITGTKQILSGSRADSLFCLRFRAGTTLK
jgi:hypothetical protein